MTLQWLYNFADANMVAINNLSCFLIVSSQKHKNQLVNIYIERERGLGIQSKLYLQIFIVIIPKISKLSHKMRIDLWEKITGTKLIGEIFYELFTTAAAFLMLIQLPDIFQWSSSKKIQSQWNLKGKILAKFNPEWKWPLLFKM